MKNFLLFLFIFFPLSANAAKLKAAEIFGSNLDPIMIKIGDLSSSKPLLQALAQDYIDERQVRISAGYYPVAPNNWLKNFHENQINIIISCQEIAADIIKKNNLSYENLFKKNSENCYIIYDAKPRALLFGFISYLKTIRAKSIIADFSQMP